MKLRSEIAEPQVEKLTIESFPASLVVARRLQELPMCTESRTLHMEPMRAVVLMLVELPMWRNWSSDIACPSLADPSIEHAEPKRAVCRIDRELPR